MHGFETLDGNIVAYERLRFMVSWRVQAAVGCSGRSAYDPHVGPASLDSCFGKLLAFLSLSGVSNIL